MANDICTKCGKEIEFGTLTCNDPNMVVVEQDLIYRLEAVVKAADNMRRKQYDGDSMEIHRKALERYYTYILDPRFD